MGTTCSGQEDLPKLKEIKFIPSDPPASSRMYWKKPALSIRFGEVEKIKSSSGKFKFILPIARTNELVKVELPVIRSYADQSLLEQGSLLVEEWTPPILDTMDTESDRQVEFKVRCEGQDFIAKAYPYQNYHDILLKNGLYQLGLYRELKSQSFYKAYALERSSPMAFVMLFHQYTCTLFDVLLYRSLAQLSYTVDEQIYITTILLNSYYKLHTASIVHRDIRPSKIYVRANKSSSYDRQSYEFANLESARKVQSEELATETMMTVRGVLLYCSQEVQDIQERDQEIGVYDALMNDRVALGKTICALETCDPYQNKVKYRRGQKLDKLCRKLTDQSIPFEKIVRQANQMLKNTSLFNHSGILSSDRILIDRKLLQLIKTAHKSRIERATSQFLFLLHQRDQFTGKLNKMIEQNYENQCRQENIPILDKLGNYYEGIGMENNDYFREEINLLVDLTEDYRKRGLTEEAEEFLEKAKEVERKLPAKMKTPVTMLTLQIELAYSEMIKGNLEKCQNYINQTLLEGGKTYEVPIDVQMKIIEAKGIIETTAHGPDFGDEYFDKGLQMCANRSNFTTHIEMLEWKGIFQHRNAECILLKLKDKNNLIIQQQRGRFIGKCQSLLLSAREIKSQIPSQNTIPLLKIYISLGDLAVVRENYEEAIRCYEKAQRLYTSSEVKISKQLKLGILNKISQVYERHIDDASSYEQVLSRKKSIESLLESKTHSTKRNFDKIRYRQQQKKREQKGIFQKQGIIQEVEDENQEQPSQFFKWEVNAKTQFRAPLM